MKTKLEMAHEWAMKHGDAETVGSRQNMIKYAWEYADAMQAEADKREKEDAAQKRKEIREMLNAPNTFVEREGQHFDDVADACKTYGSSDEWQPDWSQAPDGYDWWAMDGFSGVANWYKSEPFLDDDDTNEWNVVLLIDTYRKAPSFNYQGDWRNSLRKRPK